MSTWVEDKIIETEERGRSTLNDMVKEKMKKDGIWFVACENGYGWT